MCIAPQDLEPRVGAPVCARKQRHLDEQREAEALLRASNRDLADWLPGSRAWNALVDLANARLRAEGAALAGRMMLTSSPLKLAYMRGETGILKTWRLL